MKTIYWWSIFVFLIFVTILLFSTGMNLRSIGPEDVDGAGIGVYFLFFEINDRVLTQNIPTYAYGFFVASIITALAAIFTALAAIYVVGKKGIINTQ